MKNFINRLMPRNFIFYCSVCIVTAIFASRSEYMRPAIWLGCAILYRSLIQYMLFKYENEGENGERKGAIVHKLLYLGIGAVTIFPVIEFIFLPREIDIPVVTTGALLFISAMAVRYLSMATLRENFSKFVEIRTRHKLVTGGVYSYIRHPTYASLILLSIGSPLIMQSYLSLIFSVSVFIPILIGRVRVEERELAANLEGYREYMTRTERFIPFVY